MSKDSRRKRKIEKLERKLAKYRKKDETAQAPEMLYLEGSTADPVEDLEVENVEDLASERSDELKSDILMALGESKSGERLYGEKIHEEIFDTIRNILVDGLPKSQKEKVLENFLIPSNCKLLDAPKINMELNGLLSNPAKTRDNLLQERQQEMGLAVGNICEIINILSKKEFDKLAIIKRLSDVSRLLSNLHCQYTLIRRKLCNPFLDKKLVESLKNNKRDTYLFSNLEDSVKSFSAMKRASNALKPKTVTSNNLKPAPKNYQHPPQRSTPNQAHPGRGVYRGGPSHRYRP